MGFLRKKKETLPVIEFECKHKYRDFPWYLRYYESYTPQSYTTSYNVEILEPYVCVWCGNRKDVQLYDRHFNSKKERTEHVATLLDEYGDKMQDIPITEDQINDMILVDRDYLRAVALLHPEALVGMDENAQLAIKKS